MEVSGAHLLHLQALSEEMTKSTATNKFLCHTCHIPLSKVDWSDSNKRMISCLQEHLDAGEVEGVSPAFVD